MTTTTYTVTYWNASTDEITAPSAEDAALTIWSAEYLYVNSVDPELLPADTMVIYSEDGDIVARIAPKVETAPESPEAMYVSETRPY